MTEEETKAMEQNFRADVAAVASGYVIRGLRGPRIAEELRRLADFLDFSLVPMPALDLRVLCGANDERTPDPAA